MLARPVGRAQTLFELVRPGLIPNFVGRAVHAGKQLGGEVHPFRLGQVERIAEDGGCSAGHDASVASAGSVAIQGWAGARDVGRDRVVDGRIAR